jgi:hypothetical protein
LHHGGAHAAKSSVAAAKAAAGQTAETGEEFEERRIVLEDALGEFEEFLDESSFYQRKAEVETKLAEWRQGKSTDMEMFLYLEEQVRPAHACMQ